MKKKTLIYIVIGLVVVLLLGILILTNSKKESIIKNTDDMKKMLNEIYANLGDKLPGLENIEVDVEDENQVTNFTGLKSNKDVKELVVSMPPISSQAYEVAVIKVSKNANIEEMKQEIYDNINMNRWLCVSADKLYITNNGDVIFLIMASEDWAKIVYDEFKTYVKNDIGKELEKTNEQGDLPPEILG